MPTSAEGVNYKVELSVNGVAVTQDATATQGSVSYTFDSAVFQDVTVETVHTL